MEVKSLLVEVLVNNKEKILNSKKYNDAEFAKFIASLTEAEKLRQTILETIKEMGQVDVEALKQKIPVPETNIILNVIYLKELGLLESFGKVSEFYQSITKKNEKEGLFPDVSVIRDKHICSGCGLCVAICPTDSIDFVNDALSIKDDSCIKCGLCYACCPRSFFPNGLESHGELDREGGKFSGAFGYYKEIYTAQTADAQIKEVGQDGGIVTSLLKSAFNQKLVDAALVVGTSNKPLEPMPVFIQNDKELLKSAGTKYSNAHPLKILHKAKQFKKLAIVGTPCTLQALQKISFYPLNKPFYDNIAFKIGLFCMESFDYQSVLNIVKNEFKKIPEDVKKMNINKGRLFITDKNKNAVDIPIKDVKKYGRYGCFLCDDLTSRVSDISVGSIGSEASWSTVFVRSKKGVDLFQKASSSKLLNFKKIEDDSKNLAMLTKIAKSKLKMYKEIPRQKMHEQEALVRRRNFEEVPFGFTEEMVKLETQRCLQCGNPLCVTGCPVNVDIPGFIALLKQEKFQDAIRHVKNFNLLPAICGRVCPQENQCEGTCLLGSVDKPVAIGTLERFIADWERKNNIKECPECEAPNGVKVAIVGSGPSGLTCAVELAKKGYDVTIFEAFHTGGGVLVYGIPEFRLPKEIVRNEVETLKMLGVKIEYDVIVGKTLNIDDLKKMGFKAFFIGVGAGLPVFINVPGLNLNGVLSANEFLTRANLMKAYKFPEYDTPIEFGKKVIVVGGGNVAMDSARVALRLGAEKVMVVYRRSEEEMPARKEEYHHGQQEGIDFHFLENPTKFIGDKDENVKQIEVIRMKLGEPDKSGRRSPVEMKGSEYLLDADIVIVSIGTSANPIATKSIPNLKLTKAGYIETSNGIATNLEGIFAGGDIVTGSATVISAMGAGLKASKAIHEYLQGIVQKPVEVREVSMSKK